MLKGIPNLLSPELLKILMEMGHGDTIVIGGVKQLRGGVSVPDYNDHRMVMLASIAATVAAEPICVAGVNALNKSWPDYINVYKQLGGKAE